MSQRTERLLVLQTSQQGGFDRSGRAGETIWPGLAHGGAALSDKGDEYGQQAVEEDRFGQHKPIADPDHE